MLDIATYHPLRTAVRRRVALVAHASRRAELLDWTRANRDALCAHHLVSTGSTHALLVSELGLDVARIRSCPLETGHETRAGISDGAIDMVVFFWDPLEPHPRDADVRTLLRTAVAARLPIACTRASADFMLSSPHAHDEYARRLPTFDERRWHPEIAVAARA